MLYSRLQNHMITLRGLRIKQSDGKYVRFLYSKTSFIMRLKMKNKFVIVCLIILWAIVKSKIATNFRRWATERLKEYMIKGFTMDDERLKENGGGNYWKELLDRIRDIRSSEKVMYRQKLS